MVQIDPNTGNDSLKSLDKKLWTAADKLRVNLDAAVYKHAVLGLIFLKYVSDSFELRQQEVEAQLRDPKHDYHLDPSDYGADEEYAEEIQQELEVRDYYAEENVFWVPALARWKTIQESATLASGTEITVVNGKKKKYKITSIGKLIDDALAEVVTEPVSGKALAAGESSDDSAEGYRDIPGFCKSASLEEIAEHAYVLTPGRYVGAEEVEDDGIPFGDKMTTLATEFAESAKLQKAIRKNMKALGFELPVGGGK